MTAERLHLHAPQTLLPQPLLLAPLQPALQEAAEAAEHDDDGPDQPEAGETGQEGVGALRHHHGSDGSGCESPPRQEEVVSDQDAAYERPRRPLGQLVIRLSGVNEPNSGSFITSDDRKNG